MKKTRYLLLPLLLTPVLAGCNQGNILTKEDKNNLINLLLGDVNINFIGNYRCDYPENYSTLSYKGSTSANIDYTSIHEEDGSITPAVRYNYDDGTTATYLENDEGYAVVEALNNKNEVVEIPYEISYLPVIYQEHFANPFMYVDHSDIDNNYNLDTTIASYIVKLISGMSVNVKSAKFILDENKNPTQLDLEISDRVDAIYNGNEFLSIVFSYDFSLMLNVDFNKVEHLKPGELADNEIKNAIVEHQNYTFTTYSDSLTAESTVYVMEDQIYVHYGIDSVGAIPGDKLYVKNGDTYNRYAYKSNNTFELMELNLTRDDIVPNLGNISPNIFKKDSTNNYYLDTSAATLNAELFLFNEFNVYPGEGLFASVILNNGNIASFRSVYHAINPIIISQNYFDYGTTSLPSWLDINLED